MKDLMRSRGVNGATGSGEGKRMEGGIWKSVPNVQHMLAQILKIKETKTNWPTNTRTRISPEKTHKILGGHSSLPVILHLDGKDRES